MEELYPAGQCAQCQSVRRDRGRGDHPCFRALRSIHLGQHRGNHVVNVDEFDGPVGVGNLDRQIAGDIATERRDDRVVVRPAPFSEHILEAEDAERGFAVQGQLLEHLLGAPLAGAIGIVEFGLD